MSPATALFASLEVIINDNLGNLQILKTLIDRFKKK